MLLTPIVRNRQNSTPKADWNPEAINPDDAPRAVREYLETLDDAAFGAASPVIRLSSSRTLIQHLNGLVRVAGLRILLILQTI